MSCHSRRSSLLSPRRKLRRRSSPQRSVGSMSRDSPLQRSMAQSGKSIGQCIDTLDGLPRSPTDTHCRIDLRRAALLRSILQRRESTSPMVCIQTSSSVPLCNTVQWITQFRQYKCACIWRQDISKADNACQDPYVCSAFIGVRLPSIFVNHGDFLELVPF